MKDRAPDLSLEDLARLVCSGDADEELQGRLTDALRADPRFTRHFGELEAMAAEAGTDDLLEGLERHQEFERLLTATSPWEDPAEILDPHERGLYQIHYRQLLTVAESRLKTAEDPKPIRELKDRLLEAEKSLARQAVFAVAEALEHLSEQTADKVVAEVRRKYWRQPAPVPRRR